MLFSIADCRFVVNAFLAIPTAMFLLMGLCAFGLCARMTVMTSVTYLFRRQTWIHALIIALMAAITYSNSLHNDFLMDDHVDLFSPQGVAHKSLGEVFTKPQLDIYRPISHLVLWSAHRLFGADVFAYHAANLGFFILISILFYLIIRSLYRHGLLAFLSALLYAMHPINGMLVNYVSAMQVCIYVLTTQLSFLFLMFAVKKGEHRLMIYASLAFYALSLMTHEMSYFFPFIVTALLYFVFRFPKRNALLYSVPFFALAAIYYLLRFFIFQLHGAQEGPGYILSHLGLYASSYVELISWYLSKLMIPLNILFLWSSQLNYQIMNFEGKAFLGIPVGAYGLIAVDYLLLLLMLTVPVYLIWGKWKKGMRPFFLFTFAVGMLAVGYAGYVYFPMAKPIIEPHWFYFTSIGFYILLASVLVQFKKKLPWPVWGCLVAFILTGYFASTGFHNKQWRNQEAYANYWISLNRGNMTPYYWLGKTYMERGDYPKAVRIMEEGQSQTIGTDARIAADLGWAYFQTGNAEQALKQYNQSASLGGIYYAPLNYYFGEYYLGQGNTEKALIGFDHAARLDPQNILYRTRAGQIRQAISP